MSLLDEAARMPAAAALKANEIGLVRTPEEYVPLRDLVRQNHRSDFAALTAALDERFNYTNAALWACSTRLRNLR
jgi:hypothetical protein